MFVEPHWGNRPPADEYPWLIHTPWIALPYWKEAEIWCIHTFPLLDWTRYASNFYFREQSMAAFFLLRWD